MPKSDNQKAHEYPPHVTETHFLAEHDSKTTLVFLPGHEELSWSILSKVVSLMTTGTVQ